MTDPMKKELFEIIYKFEKERDDAVATHEKNILWLSEHCLLREYTIAKLAFQREENGIESLQESDFKA